MWPTAIGMRKLVVSGKEVMKALLKNGFTFDRSKGGHYQLIKVVDGTQRLVTIPVHGNRDLHISIIRSIIKQSGMSEEEFEKMFK